MPSSERDVERLSRLNPSDSPALPTPDAARPVDRLAGAMTADTAGSGAGRRIVGELVATFVCFAAAGTVAGTWFSRVPAVRDQLHANLRTLGFVMLCFGIGSLLSMPFTGRLIQRFSARRVCTVGSIGGCLCLPVLSLLSNTLAFAGVLLLAGACWGAWNVTLSVHGAVVEARFGRAVMPTFYGFLSGGIILGSAGGALLTAAGVGLTVHFTAVVLPLLAIVLVAIPFWNDQARVAPHSAPADTVMVSAAAENSEARPGTGTPNRRYTGALSPQVLRIGLIAFCCAVASGATSDWLAIHAHDDKGLTQAVAAAVFTTFSVAQMIGQFAGGRVIDRIGRVRTLRICGLVAAAGVAATIVLPGFGVFFGAALWGVGLALVEPITLTAAGDIGGVDAPRTIATVSTLSWSAFLVGAPVVGLLAQQFSLGSALWAIVGMALAVSLLAGSAAPAAQQELAAGATEGSSTN